MTGRTISHYQIVERLGEGQPWIEDTFLEFVTFPTATHDDRVNGTSQALPWLQRRRSAIDAAFFARVMGAYDNLSEPSAWRGGGSEGDRLPQHWSM